MKKLIFILAFVNTLFIYGEVHYSYYHCDIFNNSLIKKDTEFTETVNEDSLLTQEQINHKYALFYGVPDSTYLRIENEFIKFYNPEEPIFASMYFYEKIAETRGLDFYNSLHTIHNNQIKYFFNENPENFGDKEYLYLTNRFKNEKYLYDIGLFKFVGKDSIVIKVNYGSVNADDAGITYSPLLGDSLEIAKTQIINDILFFLTKQGYFEPLFIRSKEPTYYKNSLGKFYFTGYRDEIQFFDQKYQHVYQVLWAIPGEIYGNHEGVRIIWYNENFELLRIGTLYGNGYYKVFK